MHTEGKWTVQPFKHQIFIDSENHYIADMFKQHQSREEQLANAERICQIHNSFDDLLEACKGALEQFNNLETMADDDTTYLSTAQRAELEQAIAQAEKPE